MYGRDSPQLPWDSPRRRTPAGGLAGGEIEQTRRFSTGFNYAGMDGSSTSSGSGGFTNVPPGGGHSRGASHGGYSSGASGASAGNNGGGERTNRDKVNQIIRAFFTKAAMIIIQTRAQTRPLTSKTGVKKVNKWFNIELDETDAFRRELDLWRYGDSFEPRPPPLIIETYLDTRDLTANQSLVILDADGKKWNVDEATDAAAARAGLNAEPRRSVRGGPARHEVILERWTVELGAPFDVALAPELPVVYKKGIVMFRALYTYAGLMPTWKFRRRLLRSKLNPSPLKVNCRVINGNDYSHTPKDFDLLYVPLCQGEGNVVETYQIEKVDSPAGSIKVRVSYRQNCDFRVDDSEALLSSQFLNLDEHFFRPPPAPRNPSQPSRREMSSLPSAGMNQPPRSEFNQTYGSLSSFHQQGTNPIGASPLSALRSAAEMADRASPTGSPIERPTTGLRSMHGSKASLRSVDGGGAQRRSSVSFMQPFKSPSLSASPANSEQVASSPRTSLNRVSAPVAPLHRQRPSLGAMPPSSGKMPPPSFEPISAQHAIPISNAGPSPLAAQPMTRITSSFGSRRPRIASGASRTDDDNNSSGKASYSSSAAPGSGLYADTGANSNEDLQIRDFMRLLANGQNQTLKSFGNSSGEASSKRTGNALSKYQKMRDSHISMADSISSSLLLQPSSPSPSTSSRHLSNVPAMMPSTEFSSSSLPGKPISPHTPHTPAIPSRLSAGLTAQHASRHGDQQGHSGRISLGSGDRPERTPSSRASSSSRLTTAATTSPLDIPSSPRPFGPRRSNSVSQQQQRLDSDSLGFDPLVPYGPEMRQSASLGSIDTAPLSMSRLLDLQNASATNLPGTSESGPEAREDNDRDDAPAFGPIRASQAEGDVPRFQQRRTTSHRGTAYSSSGSPGHSSRGRVLSRGRGSSTPPTTGSASSSVGGGTRPSGGRAFGYTKPGAYGEEDDLLFTMSDMSGAQQSRRSLDQERGGRDGSTGSSARRRGSRGGGAGSIGEGSRGAGWS
ncbi:unnamed protein product [Tuber melanosporum]|uniref:Autophagy-related protein 13 n=1 Tax=Tuber melanosporum (strain Mel28) TaxID=656061 RepID=D5GFQ6_TUBMM|nr:uncharacterized protein GSTUM_00007009001 [Tuber melanosporum]CAZ83349.1 unnamed protein product [Tuber melanosporum]